MSNQWQRMETTPDVPLKLVREVASTSCGMESTYEQNAGHWDVVRKEKKIEGRL